MGMKTAAVFVSTNHNLRFLTKYPKHNLELASKILSDLSINSYQSRTKTNADSIFGRKSHYFLGAYQEGFVLADTKRIYEFIEKPNKTIIPKILSSWPKAEMLIIQLDSVVNWFGYAYYREGRLIRALGGDADHGVTKDEGEALPVEKRLFEKSRMRNGARYFYEKLAGGEEEEFDFPSYGETLTTEVVKELTGMDLYSEDLKNLELEQFVRWPSWMFWKTRG